MEAESDDTNTHTIMYAVFICTSMGYILKKKGTSSGL